MIPFALARRNFLKKAGAPVTCSYCCRIALLPAARLVSLSKPSVHSDDYGAPPYLQIHGTSYALAGGDLPLFIVALTGHCMGYLGYVGI